MKALRPWVTLERRTVLAHSRFLTVESHRIQLPDGQVIEDWPWVIIPSASIVVARTVEGDFLCFRQVKYAVKGVTLAPVGGMIETGETPLEAARRELLEETGYAAGEWVSLGSYVLDPNRGGADMHLFLALGAERAAEADADDLEDQQLVTLAPDEFEAAVANGEFQVLAWAAAAALALNYLHSLEEAGG